jgi:hypothetical protein
MGETGEVNSTEAYTQATRLPPDLLMDITLLKYMNVFISQPQGTETEMDSN